MLLSDFSQTRDCPLSHTQSCSAGANHHAAPPEPGPPGPTPWGAPQCAAIP